MSPQDGTTIHSTPKTAKNILGNLGGKRIARVGKCLTTDRANTGAETGEIHKK
jgi:hypothetical protein